MRTRGSLTLLLSAIGAVAVLSACGPAVALPPPATPTPVPVMPTLPPEQDSWILVDLPADATQLQHGAEVYRLVCSACHAYSGEGLTDAWRSTWAPEDQNCWKSKCHAANHPPDGFELPIAPAIVGPQALAPFATAADLHDYIQARMPWQDPNGLTEAEGWAVTAYVIKLNRMNPGPELNRETASRLSLHAGSGAPTAEAASPQSESRNGPPASGTLVVVADVLLIAVALFAAWMLARRRKRQR